ncbi:MAG: glycosyltransferase [Desulfarculaceae bacterium]|jgi:glycosyltransferase involved in cell wall biosynthesis
MNPDSLSKLKVVLVHDWLTGMRGGEKVLEAFGRLFPQAPIYTLLHLPGSVSPQLESHPIHTSFVQRLPWVGSRYRYYLPLFPRAIEGLKLPDCDLVLSSSHCVAKGIRPPQGAIHVSYLHTPMRYVWDMYEAYFGRGRGGLASYVMPWVRPYLQRWDVDSCSRVHHFLANSAHVAGRIKKHYDRRATVIHPPVDTARFQPAQEVEDYYLVVSALVPYKRVDLAVSACSQAGLALKVVGKGPEWDRLKSLAGPTVEFLGWQSDQALPGLYAQAKALIFPGEEDFGITPVESMASGRPVVALARGGALETVIGLDDPQGRQPTGVFFREQNTESIIEALATIEARNQDFDPQALAAHAAAYDNPLFLKHIKKYLQDCLQGVDQAEGR